jgi:hypothetical protein
MGWSGMVSMLLWLIPENGPGMAIDAGQNLRAIGRNP